jgi:diguanylate cyclase (GGDEF)-like protein
VPLDYNSLLLAVGLSAAGLCLTFFVVWLSSRTEWFMLTWAVGLLLVVGNIFAFTAYERSFSLTTGAVAFGLLVLGIAVFLGAARQFRTRRPVLGVIATVGVPAVLISVLPFAFGLDGLGAIIGNLVAAVLLLATGLEYWRSRRDAPLAILGLTFLYVVVGLSFVPCAVVLIGAGQLSVGQAPDNWTEDLNLIACIVGMTGVGALSLSLNQARIARRHQQEAETDALTGLLNRRALFERHGRAPLPARTAVVLFDLDAFKAVNDRHGHAAGDAVLRRFTEAIRASLRPGDTACRMGGEEFALVLPAASAELALQMAETIRSHFEREAVITDAGPLTATTSAGLCYSEEPGNFDDALRRADAALYRAKRDGRNRVVACNMRLVA